MVREAPKVVITDDEVPLMDFRVKTIQWYLNDGRKFLHSDFYESFGLELASNLWPGNQFESWADVLKYLGVE